MCTEISVPRRRVSGLFGVVPELSYKKWRATLLRPVQRTEPAHTAQDSLPRVV